MTRLLYKPLMALLQNKVNCRKARAAIHQVSWVRLAPKAIAALKINTIKRQMMRGLQQKAD